MEFNPSVSSAVPFQKLVPTKGRGFDQSVIRVGDVYKLTLEADPYTGVGTYKSDGKSYCGKFEEGKFTFGTCEYSEKFSYHGSFQNDLPHGKGIITYLYEKNVSCTFQGNFNRAINFPYWGKLTYSDGTVYQGEFFPSKFDLPEPRGKGKLTYPKGEVFEGEFLIGLPYEGQMLINGQKQTGAFYYRTSDSDISLPIHHTVGRYVIHSSGICHEGKFIVDQTKRAADGELTTDAISTKRMKHS